MTTEEFSNEFDTLLNSYSTIEAFGKTPSTVELNEYEKSVFLTKAQEEIIKNYFEPAGNKYGKGLDESPKRQIDFSELIKVGRGVLNTSASTITFDNRAVVYDLPTDIFLVINEAVDTNVGTKQIVPISYSDYTRLMSRPYKEPVKYQAWRIITTSINNISVELIVNSNETITDYKVRYIRRPAPIITTNLSSEYDDVTINGVSTISECELNPIIHSEILQRAVELAKAAYQGDLQASVELGKRSE